MLEKFMNSLPEVPPSAWVHKSACLIGRVKLGALVSVWPGAVIRGDVDRIEIGPGSNIQDLAVLHPNSGKPVLVGEGVTVGHSAIIHGSVVGSHSLVGMGSVIMDSEIGEYCLIAAGTVVAPGSAIPAGSMVMGAPGRIKRQLTEQECAGLVKSGTDYVKLAGEYMGEPL
ncbi:MAG: gamma carbonic anhydrase family protein [Elusimicrobia bacterium CG_4_10_14_0_2_um_filter_56_8]|nr:MAG: gamma carbonic anhydrase family protein [Elusimicrobia bacterium CG1_02_56_21]PJA15606.1 MAG: gamma carbonic anhydrase family protein [Elusimicrobia bacterium CG_4_10_14_0_2_um_filter_56_8]